MSELSVVLLSFVPIFLIPLTFGALLPWQADIRWPSRWWFGIISLGLVLTVAHALKTPKHVTPYLIALLLLPALIQTVRYFFWRRKNNRKHDGSFWRENWPAIIILLGLLGCAYLRILSYPIGPADWDTIAIWLRKTKLLYAWLPMGQPSTEIWGGNYMNYPHLGPMLEAMVIRFGGSIRENCGRLIFPTFYFFWMSAFYSLGHSKIKGVPAFLISFLTILFFDSRSFTNGYQDGFAAVLAGMAAIHFCRIIPKSPVPDLARDSTLATDYFLAFFFAGMLSFVKSEGAILALVMGFSALAVLLVRQSRGRRFAWLLGLVPYLALFLLLLGLWPMLLLYNHANLSHLQDQSFSAATFLNFFHNLNRGPLIGSYYLAHLKAIAPIVLSCGFLSALAFIFCPSRRHILIFLWMILLIHSVMIAGPYFVTGVNPAWHLQTSFERLMFQHFFVYPLVLYLAASFLADTLFDRSGHSGTPETPLLPRRQKRDGSKG